MNDNKLVIAAAGSGKTTFLVEEALKLTSPVLITTFTIANEVEIRKRIIKINKFIPDHITIQTWFSFLLQHGAKPFQGKYFQKSFSGLHLISGSSAQYVAESNLEKHYFNSDMQIFSDKLAKFAVRCNSQSHGAVINRLAKIYPHIFIDEVQDLAGYDLDVLKLLLASPIQILLVGDPRQGTYSTNNSAKGKKFRRGAIVNFFEAKDLNINTDTTTLTKSYRCNAPICKLSDQLYPDYRPTVAGHSEETGHDGLFLVKKEDVKSYLERYNPVQLRYNSMTPVDSNYEIRNFGESKGLEFPRTLLYLTSTISNWLLDNSLSLASTTRSKFYVAVTRARYSTAIVYDYNDTTIINGFSKFI